MNLLRLGGSRHVIHLLQTPVASFSLSKCQSPPNGRLCVICPLLPIQSPFPSFHPPLTPWLSHQCWNTSGLPLPQGPCTCCSFCRKCFPKYPQGFPPPLRLLPHLCSRANEPFIYVLLFLRSQVDFPRSILSSVILTTF